MKGWCLAKHVDRDTIIIYSCFFLLELVL